MKANSWYDKEMSLIYHNIQYYQQMIILSTDPYQRMFYQDLLNNEVRRLNYWQWYNQYPNYPSNQEGENAPSNQREFTLEELAQYDGSGGRPAYVAVNGIVYDVSLEATWGGGTHFSLYAGRDLTGAFMGCHGGRPEILKNLPQVGVLKP
ncbi:cytochrome b5 domain-containing protein [Natronincola ferrireducens]|uniref:Predicted heme/steroid binding protein n=1 Tax=Natronincola ferrireducens TaxID=393762 RepID=A0A1G9GC95_9FIRM|nr:cytochrome b5 domain-containing protein [Natronincola ferrireducens]SDK98289.1 Predicted heme/steroid binding protein [Natronincola ferrireducens]